jgi:hypothetical protein
MLSVRHFLALKDQERLRYRLIVETWRPMLWWVVATLISNVPNEKKDARVAFLAHGMGVSSSLDES